MDLIVQQYLSIFFQGIFVTIIKNSNYKILSMCNFKILNVKLLYLNVVLFKLWLVSSVLTLLTRSHAFNW